ncbi:MAG: DEAD/DEAH box helicase [Lachnospiraceae bacterium]|nr:DEAD/DEAH box helicase [Lachnospiraceae bacterium]
MGLFDRLRALSGRKKDRSPEPVRKTEPVINITPAAEEKNSTGDTGSELAEAVNAQALDSSLMISKLRKYQEFGARYILRQKHVLLGDEMGLGKTIQAIAAMADLKSRGMSRFLVVCPLSVMVNWAREIEKHSRLTAVPIHGYDREDEFRAWTEDGHVGVTSYETLSRLPFDEVKSLDMLVVDEAHNVKNSRAKRTANVLLLVQRSKQVLYMTGTPLENRLDEMRYLLGCIDPATGVKLKAMPDMMDKSFREAIAGVYLRRCREDVLTELPELIEVEEWLDMNEAEKDLYKESLKAKNFMSVRRLSWNAGEKSGKLERLKELCEEAVADGRKVLVFSYFLETLAAAGEALGELTAGLIYGGVEASERQGIIDDFAAKEGGAVLFGQVTAAGVGLNIQAASVVIFCEPQLKPSIEEQAIARAYRMGQERGVTVYRLLMRKTMDERITEILKEKQELFDRYADRSAAGEAEMRLNSPEYQRELMESELQKLRAA